MNPITSLLAPALALTLVGCSGTAEPEAPAPGDGSDGPTATATAGVEGGERLPGPQPITPPPATSLDSAAAVDLPEDWRLYEDPVSGGSFGHPRDWLVRPAQGPSCCSPTIIARTAS